MVLASSDAVSPIKLFLYGIMVKLQVPHNGENIAPQTAETLPQQEETVGHPSQLQILLSVRATDAAVEERQLNRRVDGHGETWERGDGLWLEVVDVGGGKKLETEKREIVSI